MALFGKKKRADSAPATPEAASAATLEVAPAPGAQPVGDAADQPDDAGGGAFDFDAIARDLDASDGPSPFDDLLAQPAAPAVPVQEIMAQDEANAATQSGDLAGHADGASGAVNDFDPFPAGDAVAPADFGAAPAMGTTNAPAPDDAVDLDEMFGATSGPIDIAPIDAASPVAQPYAEPMAASATAPVALSDEALLHTAPILTTDIRPASGGVAVRRGLPLMPLLGAGALLLALAGAGWYVFSQQQPVDEAPAPVVATRPVAPPPAAPAPVPATGVVAAPVAPGAVRSPSQVPPSQGARPGVPPTNEELNNTKPFQNNSAPRVVKPASATQAQLKRLWRQGADAKHRGDIASARRAWQEMLRLRPGHPGVQSAIDKLPQA